MTRNNSREPAYRVLAKELMVSDEYYKLDPDQDKSPNYLVLPSGEDVNRVMVSGSVTTIEEVAEDYWKAKISDGSGSHSLIFAGEWQREVANKLRETDVPEFVSVVGKPQVEEVGGNMITSIRPEEFNTIESLVRDYRIYEATKMTLSRLGSDGSERSEESYTSDEVKEVYEGVREALENLSK